MDSVVYSVYLLEFLRARYENERSERFRMANFTVPFFSGTERNGKNAFILAPRKVVEQLERFSLCGVNTV